MAGQFQAYKDRSQTYRRMRCSTCFRASINADKLEDHVRAILREALSDASFRVRFVPGDVAGAQQAVEQAEAELEAYLTSPALSALGDAFVAGAEVRQQAVELAREEYEQLVSQAARSFEIPAANELDNPEQFLRAVSAVVEYIEVQPGRGEIGERVGIVWA